MAFFLGRGDTGGHGVDWMVGGVSIAYDAYGPTTPCGFRRARYHVLVEPARIICDGRARRDHGDISQLAASIADIGLLHPVVIDGQNRLIAGQRRLLAMQSLGWTDIPVTVATTIDDALAALQAEADENTCRKAYTPEEAVALGARIEAIERPRAQERQSQSGGDKKSAIATQESVVQSLHNRSSERTEPVTAVAAKSVGMSRPTYERAKAIVESKDERLIAEMNRTGRVNGVFKRLAIQQKAMGIRRETPPLPDGRFRVIVCDPPWRYANRSADPTHRASNPYPDMSIDEIAALPVREHAHDDCILWLWTTNAHIEESFQIVRAWGFEHKTILTWAKDRIGLGDWLRGQTEHCLLCVRGKPTVTLTNQSTLLRAPAGPHSQKPDAFYELVESLCPAPDGGRLEMFQRTPRDGWIGHGDES